MIPVTDISPHSCFLCKVSMCSYEKAVDSVALAQVHIGNRDEICDMNRKQNSSWLPESYEEAFSHTEYNSMNNLIKPYYHFTQVMHMKRKPVFDHRKK